MNTCGWALIGCQLELMTKSIDLSLYPDRTNLKLHSTHSTNYLPKRVCRRPRRSAKSKIVWQSAASWFSINCITLATTGSTALSYVSMVCTIYSLVLAFVLGALVLRPAHWSRTVGTVKLTCRLLKGEPQLNWWIMTKVSQVSGMWTLSKSWHFGVVQGKYRPTAIVIVMSFIVT